MTTAVKPGWKTTEFWVTAFVIGASTLSMVAGLLPAEWASIVDAVAAAFYAISRALSKRAGTNEDLRNEVLEVLARRAAGNAGNNGGMHQDSDAGGGAGSTDA